MQKSAHPSRPRQPAQQDRATTQEPSDKGQKFEPFHTPAIGRDPRSIARLIRADQRR